MVPPVLLEFVTLAVIGLARGERHVLHSGRVGAARLLASGTTEARALDAAKR